MNEVNKVTVRKKTNIPRQIKKASVSLTLQYHLSMISRPLLIACLILENLGSSTIFSHDCRRNSQTGIVCHTIGLLALEKVFLAVAGSYDDSTKLIIL